MIKSSPQEIVPKIADWRLSLRSQLLPEIAPIFTIGGFMKMGFTRQELMDVYASALGEAGLPE
jgi:hypothetical protein